MENNWYQTENSSPWYSAEGTPAPARTVPEGYAAPEIPVRKRRRGWIPWTIASVAVVALIAVSSILFASKSAPSSPLPGEDEKQEDRWEDYRDFREFFEDYFSPTEEKATCDIPRVDSFPGGELVLAPEGEELSLQEIYKRCAPWVVGIRAYPDPDSRDDYYWGTGIVATEDGVIITNAHVVTSNGKVPCRATVILSDDTEHEALLIGYDTRSDVALLKIDARGLMPAEFCDTASMEVGDSVAAIGNPLQEEFRSSMTEGIISGIDRGISYNGATMTLIQITAPINEGNSGGPLLNRSGQVIGITNMKMSSRYIGSVSIEGVSFAIPATTVKTVADSILRCGEMRGRPALGITVGAIPDKAKKQFDLPEGLYISAVSAGSDCEAKGILPGDVLLAVNGESVTENRQVLDVIQKLSVGDTLTLTIWRQEKDESRRFDVTVALVDMNTVY